jgi:hypothetical protein
MMGATLPLIGTSSIASVSMQLPANHEHTALAFT